MVRATPNSIGYVDASFALQNRLTACAVENRAGQAVKANPASLSEAAFSLASFGRPDFGASIVNAPGPGAFPIASLLWLGVPEHLADSNKRQALRSFLEWMLTKGQSATGVLGYGPLPEFFVHSERAEINSVQ
jgi:phosphate transport system substrate-binding protein